MSHITVLVVTILLVVTSPCFYTGADCVFASLVPVSDGLCWSTGDHIWWKFPWGIPSQGQLLWSCLHLYV